MGMNSFAYGIKINNSFIVKNIITGSNKVIRIFNNPIPVGATRDLLAIEGIGEADIKSSLLKGEILTKLLSKEISIIKSDIDLLQFNDTQRSFLIASGINLGLEIDIDNITQDLYNLISSGGTGGITASQHETIRQAIHFIDEGPGDGFSTNAYKSVAGQPFPTNITWWFDNTQTKKIVEKLITRDTNQNATNVTWNIYNTDGATIAHSVSDTITYSNNSLEISRTRSIS